MPGPCWCHARTMVKLQKRDDMKTKSKCRRGRPPRAEASRKALENVNLAEVNPREVLLTIAADASAPSTARVAACRALLAQPEKKGGEAAPDGDPVTRLALKLLRGTK